MWEYTDGYGNKWVDFQFLSGFQFPDSSEEFVGLELVNSICIFQFLSGFQRLLIVSRIVPRFQVFQFLSGFQSCSEISGGSSHTAFNSIPDSRVSRRRGRFRHYTSWFCFQFLSGFQMGAGVADVLAEHFAFNSFPDSSSTSHHRPASGNTLSIPFRIPEWRESLDR